MTWTQNGVSEAQVHCGVLAQALLDYDEPLAHVVVTRACEELGGPGGDGPLDLERMRVPPARWASS